MIPSIWATTWTGCIAQPGVYAAHARMPRTLFRKPTPRVLRRPRLLRSEDDLGYLLKVLRNTYFSAHRTAKRRVRAEPLPDDLERLEDPSATHPEQALDAHGLCAKVAELPEPFKEALVAIDVLGLSYREAAQALKK